MFLDLPVLLFKSLNIFSNSLSVLPIIIIMGKKIKSKNKIPSFIRKLVQILQNEKLSDIVGWLPQGNSFQIINVPKFNEQVLSAYFKHKNMTSFTRQLNMYGFIRPKGSNQYIYQHRHFQKNNSVAMRFIRRKNCEGGSSDREKNGYESESESQFVIKGQKKQLPHVYDNLLKQNQYLKKKNSQLLKNVEKIKQQLLDQKKALSEKYEMLSTEDIEIRINDFEPLLSEPSNKEQKLNPYDGVMRDYYQFYRTYFGNNQIYSTDNQKQLLKFDMLL